jgi:hypothetical protein
MWKRVLISGVVVFILWTILDFVLHAVLLGPSYAAKPEFWRPEGEMKTVLMQVVTLLAAFAFVCVYAFFKRKTLGNGLLYGAIFGVGAGASMGYGTYSVMPMPYTWALAWFLGTLVASILGGLVVGLIVREPAAD